MEGLINVYNIQQYRIKIIILKWKKWSWYSGLIFWYLFYLLNIFIIYTLIIMWENKNDIYIYIFLFKHSWKLKNKWKKLVKLY